MITEDGYIVHKCLNGDTSAFGLLVDKYKEGVYALAYYKLHNFHDAEDITQEVFLKAFQKLRTLKWWDNFVAWLYSITSNLCKDLIRSRSKRPDREYAADFEPLDRPFVDPRYEEPEFETLHEALNSLPEMYRQVLILYYLGDMNNLEIAKFLGISTNNVAQRLKRARAKLKEEMIDMTSKTYKEKKLKAGFTFHIVEMLKRVKVRPEPRVPWLPWAISATTGMILTILYFTASLVPLNVGYASSETTGMDKKEFASQYLNEKISYESVPVALAIMPDGIDRPYNDKQGQLSMVSATQAALPNPTEAISILGKVLRDNLPVADAQVYVYDQETGAKWGTVAQTDGSFQLEIPKPESERRWGRLLIVATHPQHSVGWSKLAENNLENVVINLHKSASITGIVTDEQNNPVREAEVSINIVTIPSSRVIGIYRGYLPGSAVAGFNLKTDSTGMFTFNNLPGESNANIDISGPGYAKERKFNIPAGSQRITINLKQGGSIEGRAIFGDTGKPAEGLKISAGGVHPTEGWADTKTDENGRYALSGLPSGDFGQQ